MIVHLMSASAQNASAVVRRVPHVGTYRRELSVTIERMYENTIDWEHLPYLHRSSFAKIECLDSGAWGFRARVWAQPFDERRVFTIELKLDRECRRWITSTLEGPGAGSEVWTHAFPLAPRTTLVVVDFFVPGVEGAQAAAAGDYYKQLYARLYDEDEQMMTERQARLDSPRSSYDEGPRILGTLAEIRAQLPLMIQFGGREFRIVEVDGALIAHATICPHRLGPLANASVESGVIECPWHGYRFDIRTRECLGGGQCVLAPAPKISIDEKTSLVALHDIQSFPEKFNGKSSN
jgi:nitrite reductase/ring-hydroxylating ferredoxin subunit